MFENIRTLWQEARGTQLKKEFLDASRRLNGFPEESAEHFARSLDYLFRFWIEKHGPVMECPVGFRREAARELKNLAKERHDRDVGAAYGMAMFSFHVEASFLPGEDASFVYTLTGVAISAARETVQKFAKPT
jgi:hypothetical protein